VSTMGGPVKIYGSISGLGHTLPDYIRKIDTTIGVFPISVHERVC
jgi:glucose dehydrogenase